MRLSSARLGPLFLVLATALAQQPAGAQSPPAPDSLVRYRITPSSLDPNVHGFDEPHYVVFSSSVKPDAPLLVFMPGTGGRPQNTSIFADVAARQGYRVIGLEYIDTPAVAQVCPRDPDPRCSESVRRKRIFGEDVTNAIDDDPRDCIVARLVTLLSALDRAHPNEGWGQYVANGQPVWGRIAVSGLSQGAGMAAYIAVKNEVARVVLFSSPWDNYGRAHVLAPWLTHGTGATPAERWFAAYHEREATADIIERAYGALRIPREHIREFTAEPNDNVKSNNPYHPSVVANGATPRAPDGTPLYVNEWRFLLGEVQ